MIEIVNKVVYEGEVVGYDIISNGELFSCISAYTLIEDYKRNRQAFSSNVYLRNNTFVFKHGKMAVRNYY